MTDDELAKLRQEAEQRARDPRFTTEPHTTEYERQLSEENAPIRAMQFELRVEDLARLATRLRVNAPGATIDVETLQPHNIRDRNGDIIGYLDLSMNEIVWHKQETRP